MANSQDALQRMLEINNKVEGGIQKHKNIAKPSSQDLDSIIENYDQMVYGNSPVLINEQEKPYRADEEYEALKEAAEKGRKPVDLENKKIPRYIVEDILRNPLDIKPFVSDNNMDALEERIKGKMPGIQSSADILKKMENNQKVQNRINEKLNPKITQQTSSTTIDYSLIKTIIESVIDEKLSNNSLINESKTLKENIPSMKIMSFDDKFLFVDGQDNVYECIMKYKGKRKRKKS